MAILKCKMCGGDIALNEEKTFYTCESCGTSMTLPKVSDEQRAALFNRGNHFRRIGDFDKALAIYENIVREDDTDAEAHWCCVLCRFGIEYVEDPNTFEYLPTCHRASFDSILEDVDYLAALEHSDGITKKQYQKEAIKISEVQKGILATSQNEEPYDVFICYKETDDNTKERTRDSVDAQEIYYQLTQEGYRVFFSRVTLEDKAGTEYEPYIFAALNSAKVMIVVGSKQEYFNSVWVKNEWSRFISLMKKDRSKLLLPCYKEMDPYDLPEQLSVLQSYDMAKIGFMQDLIRGIQKIIRKEEDRKTVVETEAVASSNVNVASLLKRVKLFLEDGDFTEAASYCERVLDQDPENAEAYLGKLMAENGVRTVGDLQYCNQPFDRNNNYIKILRFGKDDLISELKNYISIINDRNEKSRVINQKNEIYESAKNKMLSNRKENCREAISLFSTIIDWRDSSDQIKVCERIIEDIQKREEEEKIRLEKEKELRKLKQIKWKKRVMFILVGIASLYFLSLLLIKVVLPKIWYQKAVSLEKTGEYEKAAIYYERSGKEKEADSAAVMHIKTLVQNNEFQTARVYAQNKNLPSEVENEIKRVENEIKRVETVKSGLFDEIKNAAVGDIVVFGKHIVYNTSGAIVDDSLEWYVIDKEDNKLLLFARYPYWGNKKENYYDSVEEVCGNAKLEEIYNSAFTEEEKTIIIESEREIKIEEYKGAQLVSRITEKNSNKLFNLSKDEYERYCKENQSIYIGSPYVLLSIRKGKNGYSNVHNATRCRPAVWVDLSDDFNESLLENLE